MIKSLYIHIPFCKKRCFYCDFYSQTKLNLKKDYLEKLRVEAAAEKEIPHKLKSIYIGGGTPSLLTVSEIDFLFANVIGVFRRGKKCEITSEVNPESACDKKLLSLEKHGVNRLSIGFQFLDDSLLKKAGRLHTEKQAVKTFLLARETGFKNINIDIIYGFPGQSLKSFTETLDKIISLKPEHISAYLYSPPERKSPLRGKVPDENLSFKMYRHLCEKLKKNDFIHYEISNFARKNFYSEHNLNYWKGNDYIGLGAGAVSTVGNIRIKNPEIEKYLKNPAGKKIEILSAERKVFEKFFLNMRTKKGVSYRKKYEKFIKSGFLKRRGSKVFFSENGWFVSNSVIAEF